MVMNTSNLYLGKRYFSIGKSIIELTYDVQKEALYKIEDLIKNGTYEFESVPCLCGAPVENDQVLATVDRYRLKHQTVICQNCGLVRTNPRLTQASYNHFYENWYKQLHSGWSYLDENSFRREFEISTRGERIVEFLQSYQIDIAGKTVLEIGSGGGWNLPAFEQSGAKTIGFDYGKYIEFGKKLYGLDIRYGGIKEAIDQGIKADIVILAHVVEHFTNPVTELKDLRKLLESDGACYLETPGVLNIHNSYIDLMRLLQNAHTYSFSKVMLNYLVKKCNYEIQYCDEFIRMLCKPSSKEFINIKIEPQHSRLVIEYLKDCEKKRIWRVLTRRAVVAALKTVGIYPLAKKLYHKARHKKN